jgi:uncharacterized ion transporter superfamily protein YfcC
LVGHAAGGIPTLAPLGDFAGVDCSLDVTTWDAGSSWTWTMLPTSDGSAPTKVGDDKSVRYLRPLLAILFVLASSVPGLAGRVP